MCYGSNFYITFASLPFFNICNKHFAISLHQELEEELHKSLQQLSSLQSYCNSLTNQLSCKQMEVAAKDAQVNQLR